MNDEFTLSILECSKITVIILSQRHAASLDSAWPCHSGKSPPLLFSIATFLLY